MNEIFAKGAFGVSSPSAASADPSPLEIYEQAAALLTIGAFSCDLATERLSWTDGVFGLFGVSSLRPPNRQDIVGLYTEASRERLARRRSLAIATRTGFSMDASIIRPDGGTRRIRITASTRSSNGRATTLYGMKQDITEDYARWEAMRRLAECDPLTGVANRARFQSFLEQRDDAPVLDCIGALILFDMDGFKQVNDIWGHAAGDACLVAFGARLRRELPHARLIARIGGDEFAVLLPPIASRQQAEAEVSSLVGKLLRPVPWNGNMLPVSASVGLAFVSEDNSADPQELFVTADKALYDAKRSASTIFVCA